MANRILDNDKEVYRITPLDQPSQKIRWPGFSIHRTGTAAWCDPRLSSRKSFAPSGPHWLLYSFRVEKEEEKSWKRVRLQTKQKKKITSISNEDVLIWNGNILYTGFMEINGTKECMVIAKSRIQCSHILLYLETPTDQITLFNSSSYLHECNTFNFVPPSSVI